jgi:hypothetical protein
MRGYLHENPDTGRVLVMGTANNDWGADVYESMGDYEAGRPGFLDMPDARVGFPTREALLAALIDAGYAYPEASFGPQHGYRPEFPDVENYARRGHR